MKIHFLTRRTWSSLMRFIPDSVDPLWRGDCAIPRHHRGAIGSRISSTSTSATERWASPKFLIGESYGTTRSPSLREWIQERNKFLERDRIAFMVASGIWARTIGRFSFCNIIDSAWYHHLLPPDLQSLTVDQVAQKAREFAHGEYAQALEKGDQLSPAEHQKSSRISRITPGFQPSSSSRQTSA